MIDYVKSIYFLAFNSGLYSGFSKFTISLWLKEAGATPLILNIFTTTMFPSVCCVFWMPFLEKYNIIEKIKCGNKKKLIMLFEFLIAISTLSFCLFNIKELNYISSIFLIIILIIYASLISTRDALSIGYKMEFMKKENVINYDGIISSFYQAGMLTGTVFFYKLSDYLMWKNVFLLMFIYMIINFLIDAIIQNSSDIFEKKMSLKEQYTAPFKSLLIINKGIVLPLMFFLLFYNLPDRMLVGNLNYYFLDSGISKDKFIALRLIGGICSVIIGFFTVYLTKFLGLEKMLLVSTCLYSLIPFLILLNIEFNIFINYNEFFLIILFFLDKLFKSFQGNTFFSYQMQFCEQGMSSTQRSLFMFLERGFCSAIIAPILGLVLKYYGYKTFFSIVSFSLILSIYSLFWLKSANAKKRN
ncbi:MFS transporter [Alphaproteobacteria bacterium endosymbiont of Tiliacea citrago]|uniref:MFS transporter n=1 Tax=Alphaproteobacteria bacterium endosymbiont of Tiliacea citrago TaxID=3077944 RepID=UPI00313E7C0F